MYKSWLQIKMFSVEKKYITREDRGITVNEVSFSYRKRKEKRDSNFSREKNVNEWIEIFGERNSARKENTFSFLR